MLLDAMDARSVPEPGTAVTRAIDAALSAFPKQKGRDKALILLTDGEDHVGRPVDAAKKASEQGVRIYCIGVGSRRAAPIPIRDSKGGLVEYKKDRSGESIMTRFDQTTLQAIATITEGTYHFSTPGQIELDVVLKDIEKMEKTMFDSREYTESEERYQFFLLPGLAAIMLHAFLGERKKEGKREQRFS